MRYWFRLSEEEAKKFKDKFDDYFTLLHYQDDGRSCQALFGAAGNLVKYSEIKDPESGDRIITIET